MYHAQWEYRNPVPLFMSEAKGSGWKWWYEEIKKSPLLKKLADPRDYLGEDWAPLMTVSKVDRTMKYAIIVSLVSGTLIWGYGDNFKI